MGMVMAKRTSRHRLFLVHLTPGHCASRTGSRAHLPGHLAWPGLAWQGRTSRWTVPSASPWAGRKDLQRCTDHPILTVLLNLLPSNVTSFIHPFTLFIQQTEQNYFTFQASEPGKVGCALQSSHLLALCPGQVTQPSQSVFSSALLPHSRLFLPCGGGPTPLLVSLCPLIHWPPGEKEWYFYFKFGAQ